MNLSNKTVLITGATGGIGSAIALQMSEAGANLLLTGRNPEKLKVLKQQIPSAELCVADLAQSADRAKLVTKAQRLMVDIVINVAGANELALLSDTSDDKIAQLVQTNLTTPMLLARDLLPQLSARPEAAIVNVGSILGSIGYPGSTLYCATKFGLRGFTEALRRELADSHVAVIYFAPRATATAMNADKAVAMNQDLGVAMDAPEWVAEQLVNLLKRRRPHSAYLGWPEKLFVKINGILPKLVDGALLKQLPIIRRYAGQ
ncbi:SDR family oxidoreductase [Halioxenophilus sp. WMMB6]|uniref:SDR family oxidoreductase n=1 Tax=Halioxenophilus sp. WMMB6 TaxID=3073815 RepID=UPI00295F3DCF|nr:SDR family oxidoreductase [Halioxenophilus sp. WMMB6]